MNPSLLQKVIGSLESFLSLKKSYNLKIFPDFKLLAIGFYAIKKEED